MTLREWGRVNNVHISERGHARWVPQTANNWELYKLADYLVSTHTGGTIWLIPKPRTPMPFVVTLVRDGEVLTENLSHHNLKQTLRLGWELLGGIPQAEVSIRYRGNHIAWLHTNWRGELQEAEVYGGRGGKPYGVIIVTPLNPKGPIFEKVFAQ